ncbi:E3 ubiquitin-protein ligase PPP1R11 [Drosophila innubila]|uniref:E3 ubiquitin-protein ligase PPP1R11 n=1 Tax=Drosophila innubila TaxID=198719 RepID=UPI00148CE7CA|nr:E3 ubiquitin-protein ligase PPP1R11 [Drosophila innubila]
MEEQTPPPIAMERDSATIIVNEPEVASGTSGNVSDVTDDRPGVSGVHLLLMVLDSDRHVSFHEDVIDNEGMNRRKSKCCCIYRKPQVFGESSSSSDDECEHCCGHPEVRLRNRLRKQQQATISQCGCHRCHHSQQPVQAAVQEPIRDAHPQPTELAGDSGNIKPKSETPSLVSASSQSLQP